MPAHIDTMMVQGRYRRFEGQQEKQVVTDSRLQPVKTQPFKQKLMWYQDELKRSGDVFLHAC